MGLLFISLTIIFTTALSPGISKDLSALMTDKSELNLTIRFV